MNICLLTSLQMLMQFNADDLKLIPDTYRSEQMDYINSVPAVFLHRRAPM